MRNDTFEDRLHTILGDVDTEAHDLRSIAWLMECVADTGNTLPPGMFRADIDFLFARLIARQADRIKELTGPAQEQLAERRRA